MDYKPRYFQPFTLDQANLLDVAVITEEIARLQNSLSHLKKTQEILREYLVSTVRPDTEFTQAVEENDVVIGSQEERIGILKMALSHKGVLSNSRHYDTAPCDSTTNQDSSLNGRAMTDAQTVADGSIDL